MPGILPLTGLNPFNFSGYCQRVRASLWILCSTEGSHLFERGLIGSAAEAALPWWGRSGVPP